MAKAQQPEKVSFFGRIKQIGMMFRYTAKRDRLFIPLAIAAVALPLIAVAVAIALGAGWLWLPIGILFAPLLLMLVLSTRAQKAMLVDAKNQPGSSAGLVEQMRGDWRVTPAIAATTDMDMVHLVIGRPGVILLGEGNPHRVRGLITQEKRRLSKVIGSVDLRDFIVGEDEGQVPLKKLRSTLLKLPRTTTGKDVNALDKRLTALLARPQMPKGAIPKNMRPPKGAYKAMRGR